MILYDRNGWFNAVFSWRGTALRRAKWRVLSMVVYAGIIQVAYEVGVSPSLSPKYPVVSVPYGALVPAELDGLLVAGRAISCDGSVR